jgi:hypothetical protein
MKRDLALILYVMCFAGLAQGATAQEASGRDRAASAENRSEPGDDASQASAQTPGPAPEGQSQADIWRQQRLAKLPKVVPYRQTGLERGLLWVETTGMKLLTYSVFGFRPKIGGLPTGGGFALGTQYRLAKSTGPRPDLDGSAVWSMRGYQRYEARFGKVEREDRGALLYADVRHRNYPQEDFFGLGPQSRVSNRTDFRLKDTTYDGVLGYRVAPWLSTSFRFGYLDVRIGRGTDSRFPDTQQRFTDATAPGLAVQPNFFHLNYTLSLDGRDVPGNPHRGASATAMLARYMDLDRDAFSFNRLAVDADGYLPLGSTVRTLAVHFYGSGTKADPGHRVPFYLQETLGGSDTLRGFREYRFRDANLLYLSGEYRWEPVRAVELALFYDAGKVFSRRGDFDFDRLHTSFGGGIRFKTASGVVLRIDIAESNEGTRFFFKFSPSFKNLTLRADE